MFLDRFKVLCKNNGTTVRAVAKELGIGNSTVSKWLNGTTPRIEHIIMIAYYFNVSLDYLVGRNEKIGASPAEMLYAPKTDTDLSDKAVCEEINEMPMLISAKDIEKITGVSHAMAYSILNSGDIPVFKIGSRKYVKRDDFLKWLDDRTACHRRSELHL